MAAHRGSGRWPRRRGRWNDRDRIRGARRGRGRRRGARLPPHRPPPTTPPPREPRAEGPATPPRRRRRGAGGWWRAPPAPGRSAGAGGRPPHRRRPSARTCRARASRVGLPILTVNASKGSASVTTPTARAISNGTTRPSPTSASSTSHTGPRSTCSWATARASRDLPTPPGPLKVTIRLSASACWMRWSSRWRPISFVVGAGSRADGERPGPASRSSTGSAGAAAVSTPGSAAARALLDGGAGGRDRGPDRAPRRAGPG